MRAKKREALVQSLRALGQQDKAVVWLALSLARSGPITYSHVLNDAGRAGINKMNLTRAASLMRVVKIRKGFGPLGYWIWKLPDPLATCGMDITLEAIEEML